jgi:hypothetical protein
VSRHQRLEQGTRRTWGPFTGGQLTTIIVAIVVMALFPVGAWAASGSNAFVTDAVSGQHASVNSTGALNVAQSSPKSFFSAATLASQSSFEPVFVADASHAFIVTSVVVNVLDDTAVGAARKLRLAVSKKNGSCDNLAFDPQSNIAPIYFTPSGVGTEVEPFQPGFVVPAHRALCVANSDPLTVEADVFAYGFKVPAASAPAGS